MKIMKLGLIILLVLGMGACASKAIPALSDAIIRSDAEALFKSGDFKRLDHLEYTIDKVTTRSWVINGTMSVSMESCSFDGTFTLSYTYSDQVWSLGLRGYTPKVYTKINTIPTKEAVYQANVDYFTSNNDLDFPFEDMDSVTMTVNQPVGTAEYIYKYTTKDVPVTSVQTLTIDATFAYPKGWAYAKPIMAFDVTYDFTGIYHLTWDILDTETYYKKNETMTISVTGILRGSGDATSIKTLEANTLSAQVNFRGQTVTVTPTLVTANTIDEFQLKFGTEDKALVIFVYGFEDYRGMGNQRANFYGVSADGSHASVTIGR